MASSVEKELAKRRVFLFFAAFAVLALVSTLSEESDMLLFVGDDIIILSIAITTIWLILASWKKTSLKQLVAQHNLILSLFVVALIVQIAAIFLEINDPTDFGNEIPSLFLILFTLANRFV